MEKGKERKRTKGKKKEIKGELDKRMRDVKKKDRREGKGR